MKRHIKNILRNLPYYLWKKRYGVVRDTCMLWRRPLIHIEKLSPHTQRKYTQVQVAGHEPPFLVLREQDGFHLVQKFDRTFGWIRSERIIPADSADVKKFWSMHAIASSNRLVNIACPNSLAMRDFLKSFEGTPYVWGGVTVKGIDCSGFVQRVYLDMLNIVLPKHSKDQAACGVDVNGTLTDFDILHVEHKEKKQSHVAFWYDNHVHHACLSHKGVVSETWGDFEKKYDVIAKRRIISCL